MRAWALACAACLWACSAPAGRSFPVGVTGTVPSRVAAEAGRLGLEVAERPPQGAVVESAVSAESTASREQLRYQAARAAATGAAGVFWRLPETPSGTDMLSYPEEWQAVARVGGELVSLRPVLEGGEPQTVPLSLPAGVLAKAWRRGGRSYLLLVNESAAPVPIDPAGLEAWRTLFSARADARENLAPCGQRKCLLPRAVLWLEGRLL